MSKQMRECVKRMIARSGGGHAGGSLSVTDILAALYGNVMKYDPKDPDMDERDRLILSKGHSGLGLYAALAVSGYIPMEDLAGFGTKNGYLMNHPDRHTTKGVELSTGSLGHGFSLACGIALAGQLREADYFTYCILGDGECQEGSVWEAAMFASHHRLDRLVVIIDRNRIGNDGPIDAIVSPEPFFDKWNSFGFKVYEMDGHNVDEMTDLLLLLKKEANGPYALIAHTVKGKGLIEGVADTGASHYLKGSFDEICKKFEVY